MNAKKLGVAMALVAGLGMSGVAEASFILTLESGGTSVSVTDNGPGDSSPVAGFISFISSGAAVGTFDINLTAGYSKPLISNPPGSADLFLNSLNTSNAGGTLVITLIDDGYAGSASLLTLDIGGSTGGTVTAEALLNGTPTLSLGPFGPGGFAGTTSSAIAATGPYSLGARVTVVHTDTGQITVFDLGVSAVPEPATLALLGLGLAGLGFSRRRSH